MSNTTFSASWAECKRFEAEGVVVTVNKSNHPHPRYSYDVGFMAYTGDRVVRHHSVQWEMKDGKAEIKSFVDFIADICETAENWIEEQIQKDISEYNKSRMQSKDVEEVDEKEPKR